MGIIDVTIERPALKRTEITEQRSDAAPVSPEEDEAAATPVVDDEPTPDEGSPPKTGGRIRRTARLAGGTLAVGAGLLTLRSVRRRRRRERVGDDADDANDAN